jgi:hypothetical protein
VADRLGYEFANARLKRDVQLVLSAALSSGLVMRVCAPSVLCTGARHTASGSHQSWILVTVTCTPLSGCTSHRMCTALELAHWRARRHLCQPCASAAAALLRLRLGCRHDVHGLDAGRAVGAAGPHVVLQIVKAPSQVNHEAKCKGAADDASLCEEQ